MRIIKVINFMLNFVFITFFVVSLSFAGYALYDIYAIYENTELSGKILKYKPSSYGFNELGKQFSLADIKTINSDIVGWVQVDGTNIDYPILVGTTNSDYLSVDYKKEYSPGGSIFLDYRNNHLFYRTLLIHSICLPLYQTANYTLPPCHHHYILIL